MPGQSRRASRRTAERIAKRGRCSARTRPSGAAAVVGPLGRIGRGSFFCLRVAGRVLCGFRPDDGGRDAAAPGSARIRSPPGTRRRRQARFHPSGGRQPCCITRSNLARRWARSPPGARESPRASTPDQRPRTSRRTACPMSWNGGSRGSDTSGRRSIMTILDAPECSGVRAGMPAGVIRGVVTTTTCNTVQRGGMAGSSARTRPALALVALEEVRSACSVVSRAISAMLEVSGIPWAGLHAVRRLAAIVDAARKHERVQAFRRRSSSRWDGCCRAAPARWLPRR